MFGSRNQLNMPIDVSQTAINELANRPRQDITGQRYGNTLSDDMFSIKNPSLPDRHTPESYEYFNQPVVPEVNTQAWEPAAGWNGPLPVLNPNFISRQKFVGESTAPLTVNKDWGLTDDILEFPDDYTDEQYAWAEGLRNQREAAQRVNDLSTEGMLNEKFGNVPTTQSPYRDAEYDPYLGTNVNYSAMSPETMEILARMGVKRPTVEDEESLRLGENGNDSYNSLLELYRLAIQNGWR
jgi:hypothetical protein